MSIKPQEHTMDLDALFIECKYLLTDKVHSLDSRKEKRAFMLKVKALILKY